MIDKSERPEARLGIRARPVRRCYLYSKAGRNSGKSQKIACKNLEELGLRKCVCVYVCVLIHQGSKLGPRLYSPSFKMGRRRYTRVCEVRVAQCVISADRLHEPDINSIDPSFIAGCGAPLVPGVFGVHGCACERCVRVGARGCVCVYV